MTQKVTNDKPTDIFTVTDDLRSGGVDLKNKVKLDRRPRFTRKNDSIILMLYVFF